MLAAVEKVWGSTERVIMCMSHNERMLNGPGGLGADRPAGDLVFRYVLSSGFRRRKQLMKETLTTSISSMKIDIPITSNSTFINQS